jgi:hypothetical protein
VILPDVTSQNLTEGLVIAEVSPLCPIATEESIPVKFENGHFGLVSYDYFDKGRLKLDWFDNPMAMHAIWRAPNFPQVVMNERGREYYHVPKTGFVKAFYNDKKEDENYHPDEFHPYLNLGRLSLRPGFLTLNDFLCDNRLYDYVEGHRDMAFFEALGIKTQTQVMEVRVPYTALLKHMKLLVKDLAQEDTHFLMLTVVTLDPIGSLFKEFGPYYSNDQVDASGLYFDLD